MMARTKATKWKSNMRVWAFPTAARLNWLESRIVPHQEDVKCVHVGHGTTEIPPDATSLRRLILCTNRSTVYSSTYVAHEHGNSSEHTRFSYYDVLYVLRYT